MNALHRYIKASSLLMDEMQALSDDQLLFQVDEHSWNLLQVLQHLHKVEQGVIKQIVYNNGSEEKKYMKLKNHYRAHLLLLALYLPKKYKAPSHLVIPDQVLDRSEITDWEMNQKEWLCHEHLHPSCAAQVVFKHPLAGYLNFKASFNFLLAHLNHHLIQVNTIRMHKKFPNS